MAIFCRAIYQSDLQGSSTDTKSSMYLFCWLAIFMALIFLIGSIQQSFMVFNCEGVSAFYPIGFSGVQYNMGV